MKLLRVAEAALVLITITSFLFGAYFFLDTAHAKRKALLQTEIELREEILSRDIKKDAEARVYYKNRQAQGPLESAEAMRLEYIEEQLEQKYEEQRMVQQKRMELD